MAPRHSQGFLDGSVRVVHKLQSGDQSHGVEGIVFVRQIFGISSIKGYALGQPTARDIEHIRRGIETRDLMTATGEPFQELPRPTANFKQRLGHLGGPKPVKQFLFYGCGCLTRFRREPFIVMKSIFKLEDIAH
jgi:hypothetical protein